LENTPIHTIRNCPAEQRKRYHRNRRKTGHKTHPAIGIGEFKHYPTLHHQPSVEADHLEEVGGQQKSEVSRSRKLDIFRTSRASNLRLAGIDFEVIPGSVTGAAVTDSICRAGIFVASSTYMVDIRANNTLTRRMLVAHSKRTA
jgi:hypothetical protein